MITRDRITGPKVRADAGHDPFLTDTRMHLTRDQALRPPTVLNGFDGPDPRHHLIQRNQLCVGPAHHGPRVTIMATNPVRRKTS
jgi:hypothetical protein